MPLILYYLLNYDRSSPVVHLFTMIILRNFIIYSLFYFAMGVMLSRLMASPFLRFCMYSMQLLMNLVSLKHN